MLDSMSWNKREGKLVKEFTFSNFTEVVEFVNKILPIAEELNHHPDIFLHTNDKNSIIEKDHELARDIDKIE
jgi:4a-hydroxytetrahydrobiopterin dehydratase